MLAASVPTTAADEVTRHIVEEAIARGPIVLWDEGRRKCSPSVKILCIVLLPPRKALIARTMQREGLSAEEPRACRQHEQGARPVGSATLGA